MDAIIDIILNKYQIFLLILVRSTGLFVITPIFSRKNIPNILKIGLAFFMSLIIFSVIDYDAEVFNDLSMVLLIIKEFAVGLIIGFISYVFFTSMYIAGQIIDMQIGFGMVNVLDPQHNVQLPITGNFYYILAALIFLTTNGHHLLIRALVDSYSLIPIGSFAFSNDLTTQMISIFGQVFVIGFKIASPIIATIFLANVLLGILAKTMPQMNVFVVGMPFKVAVGLLVLIFTIPIFSVILQHLFESMFNEIDIFMKIISKG
ncbi:flagellar biosynthetic protein FliR [Sporosalibacterium faouarense]|uniref:flagellar biosynthetic protein FliR n=1 Tax=Sporosalibacterium faouarense TaxID=516123 RepID=UPI00141CC59A|nr:flagellar biosynthetic protein FliR [Sporosalibacterium faouarense]MTI48006.1 flagellar type III secretion system protein FliR [Bacillota bacterium]